MSKCPHCGAEVQYKPELKKVHCEYCGSNFNASELLREYKKAKANKIEEEDIDDKSPKLTGVAYSCTQCGATLLSFDETAVTFCSYCGSQNIIEEKMPKKKAPDYIIPFVKTKEQCIHNYKRKIASFLFCPSFMKKGFTVQKFRGIYMPYGIYPLYYNDDCVNHGQKYSHRSGDYVYYDDYDLHADVEATYDGITFDLLSKFYDEYSHAIPFNFKKAEEFNPNYLPGFYADAGDVDIGTYSTEAIKIGTDDSVNYLKKKWTYRFYSCHYPKVNFHVGEKKYGYFPVYFLSIRDKNDKNIYYAIINGQTGKVAADLPIDYIKYIIVSILLAIPIFFLLSGLPVILPIAINFFAIFCAVAAWIICIIQIEACNKRASRYTDKGYNHALKKQEALYGKVVDDTKKKKKGKNKIEKKYKVEKKEWLKFVIAIVLSIITILLKPVNDFFYYATAIIGLILVLWSFYDLVEIHNILVSRPIPQLEKRGGDEHE